MASKIVKAFKQAKSALRSSEALEEPEIVAVVPPPLPPKRSQPPLAAPLPPASDSAPHTPQQQQQQQQQQQSSPPLSPVLYQLENTSLADQPKKQGGGALEFVAELPDTSVPRPDEAKLAAAPEQTQDRADPTTGQPKAKQPEPDKELVEKKKKDPAVLMELPKTPSAQAYQVAHSQKLENQYFNPVFDDDNKTPREGGTPALPSPENVAAALKSVEPAA